MRRRGRPLSEATIRIRNAVIDMQFEREPMTVRGIFYALSSAGVIPKTEAGYRKVQAQVLKLRREGELDWGWVADGTRWVRRAETFDSTDEALRDVARLYRRDLWRSQGIRVEVWLEKDALGDVIWPVIDEWGVPLLVSRGTSSATFLYNAAKVAERAYDEHDQATVILALYDHDAGGERAFRTVAEGMRQYAPWADIDVRLLALDEWQIEEWQLPTRPPKRSDPEAHKWGDRPAVELDAIPPEQLRDLVHNGISALVESRAWEVAQTYEREEREGLQMLAGWVDSVGVQDVVSVLDDVIGVEEA